MVAKKSQQVLGKKSKTGHKNEEEFDNLYISLNDPHEKRKGILNSIKTSLMIQEEYERILSIRKEKSRILNEIKKDMEAINEEYQKLRKTLPNVKNVLTFTEKEISVLEESIDILKSSSRVTEETLDAELRKKEELEKELGEGTQRRWNKTAEQDKTPQKTPTPQQTKKVEEKKSPPKKLTRIERIRNNLKVIDSKLNEL